MGTPHAKHNKGIRAFLPARVEPAEHKVSVGARGFAPANAHEGNSNDDTRE
jgi:hypothetical protein